MSQMLKSSGAVAAATLTSRVLGLGRDMVYASFMGTTWVAGSFMFAFMIPNLFRRLLGEGALTAAFIPLFKEKEKIEGKAAMWRSANAVLSGLIVATTLIVMLVITGLTVALGLLDIEEGKTLLMLRLLRWMFPYILFICVAALFMAILNARGHFFVPALGATLLNVVMIASVLWLAPRMGDLPHEQVFALAYGVLIAGLLQAAFQIPLLLKEGFRFRWITPWRDPFVRTVAGRMIPGIIGVAAFQINILLTNGVAFWVDASLIASFTFAVRLMELPQGVFGLSLATYLLPTLSGLAADKKFPEFRETLREGVSYLLLLNLLASILLVVLAQPIIRLLFEHGTFDAASTLRAATALVWLAPGLMAFSLVNILARAFYSLGDVQTPMRISVFCLGLNVLFVLALIKPFREAGLGAASTMSALVNVFLLAYALKRKLVRLDWASLIPSGLSMAGAAGLAGTLAWFTCRLWNSRFGHETVLTRLGEVFVPMTLAASVYLGACLLMKVEALGQLRHFIGTRLRRRG